MRITDLSGQDESTIERVAALLVAGFAPHHPDAWPNQDAARAEVRESLALGRISRVARAEDGNADGTIIGWVGGIEQYDGHVWELHPLVVDPACQGHGIGSALVRDLEEQVRSRGGITVLLGTDDEDAQTTLGNVNLYPNLWEHVQAIRNLKRHPYEFYQKLGYSIAGVVPDANGLGKPDILMAKSVRTPGGTVG